VHRFSSNQKYFFINTNSVEGFFIAAAPVQRLFQASSIGVAKKQRFLAKNGHFQSPRGRFKRCTNVLIFYIRYIGTNTLRLRPRRTVDRKDDFSDIGAL
jgi:hypothetical protein